MPIQVIFHIDEMEKWGLLLKNVHNLIAALGDRSVQLEVLANAEAVRFYIGQERQQLADLSAQGVDFAACANALAGLGIPKNELPAFIRVVPAGVLELAERQQQGYAYIKP